MKLYIDSPLLEYSIFQFDVSFEVINFFKTNYDVMYLKELTKVGV